MTGMYVKNGAGDLVQAAVVPAGTVIGDGGGGAGELLAEPNTYYPDAVVNYTPPATGAPFQDIDATYASTGDFVVPDSGIIYVRFEAQASVRSQAGIILNLRDGATDIPRTGQRRIYVTGVDGSQLGITASWKVTGLPPGTTKNLKVGFVKLGLGANASTITVGGQTDGSFWGPMTTVVSASPLS